jgi:hypothetical protein
MTPLALCCPQELSFIAPGAALFEWEDRSFPGLAVSQTSPFADCGHKIVPSLSGITVRANERIAPRSLPRIPPRKVVRSALFGNGFAVSRNLNPNLSTLKFSSRDGGFLASLIAAWVFHPRPLIQNSMQLIKDPPAS